MDTNDRTIKMLADALSADGSRSVAEVVCANVPRVLPVEAVALTLAVTPGNHHVLSASDDEARRLEELQHALGEGPSPEALRTASVVVAANLSDPNDVRWPVFAEEVGTQRPAYLTALSVPLAAGGAPVGVLDLFGWNADPDAVLDDARFVAHAVTLLLVDAHIVEGDDSTQQLWSADDAVIHQATGMLVVQLGINPQDALARLRAHAFAESQTVQQVARAVLDRSLRLDRP